jgi:hypothetical protein
MPFGKIVSQIAHGGAPSVSTSDNPAPAISDEPSATDSTDAASTADALTSANVSMDANASTAATPAIGEPDPALSLIPAA